MRAVLGPNVDCRLRGAALVGVVSVMGGNGRQNPILPDIGLDARASRLGHVRRLLRCRLLALMHGSISLVVLHIEYTIRVTGRGIACRGRITESGE